MAGEDDEHDLGIAEHRELVGTVAELAKGDLAVHRVLKALYLDLAPPVLAARASLGAIGL
jgi:hypothetical protein